MPLIKNSTHRWVVWYTIFATLPLIIKKDKDDTDGLFYAMFPEFKNQIQHGSIMEVMKIANAMISFETRLCYMLRNKVRADFLFSNFIVLGKETLCNGVSELSVRISCSSFELRCFLELSLS